MPNSLAIGVVASLVSAAGAQTITGNARLSAQCNAQISVPYTAGSGSRNHNGVCPGQGGSINDASTDWTLSLGHWFISNQATTDYFGTNPNGASSESVGLVTIEATDLVFTDTANPQRRDFIRTTMNFLTGVVHARAGRSNCSPFTPNLSSTFSFRLNDLRAEGSRGYIASTGNYATGVIALADPVDGTLIPHATSSGSVQLTVATTFSLTIDGYANVSYCGQPPAPAERGVAMSSLRFVFPCDGPVFNLPPNITVNSVQLGIRDNRWIAGGPVCCPADFNADGFLDFFDYLDYVTCFETGTCAPGTDADFNGDGFADFFDYADFVTAFEAGC